MTAGVNSAAPRAPLPFLGLACAVGVSTIYYNQPLLLDMSHTYGATAGRTGFVAVATQVGYAFGLLMFVPLGDVVERRGLMMKMYAAAAISLLLVAVAPTLDWLIVGSFVMGMLASVTHVVVPIAPDLVPDRERGRAIGMVMTGLLLGILLARTFAGWVSRIHGWRYVFVVAAVMNAAFVPLLWRVMPKLPPKAEAALSRGHGLAVDAVPDPATVAGELHDWRAGLCVVQLLLDDAGVFSGQSLWPGGRGGGDVWAGGGGGGAGCFVCGADVGPPWVAVGGRLRHRVLALSYALLWGAELLTMSRALHLAALVVGVIVLDMGAQMTQVANQTRIFGLVPSARSRINTVYMTVYFGGAAVGSALATQAWARWHWNGVCLLALGLIALAGLVHATGTRDVPTHKATRQDELMEA